MKTNVNRITVLLALVSTLGITGCSSLQETVTATTLPGYRHYDPCIRCGESWVIAPNQPFAAIHQSKDKPGFTKSDYEAGLREMYGPNWREVQKKAQSSR